MLVENGHPESKKHGQQQVSTPQILYIAAVPPILPLNMQYAVQIAAHSLPMAMHAFIFGIKH